jgi:hypothetical protein
MPGMYYKKGELHPVSSFLTPLLHTRDSVVLCYSFAAYESFSAVAFEVWRRDY